MRRYNIFYFIAEAFKSLKRNGAMTFASIAVLLSCLLVIGGFSLLVLNIDANLNMLGSLNDIVVFCEPDATAAEVEAVSKYISSLDNIEHKYTSKSDQLKELQREDPELYGSVTEDENPLSDSFTITYKDNDMVHDLVQKLTDTEYIEAYCEEHNMSVPNIRKVNNRLDLAQKIENVKSAVMLIFFWFLAILFVVSIFIIINTIKIAVLNRKKEISIMRYIGASAWFIALPFIFEGVILGFFSGIGSYFIIRGGYALVMSRLGANLSMITFISFSEVSVYMLLGALVIGIFTGIVGSAISLGKYLKD